MGRFCDALLDDFLYYNGKVLSTDDLEEIMYRGNPPTDNLSIYWKFDEGSGTTATDSSGNGNDGTIAGTPYSTDVFLSARSSSTNRFLVRDIKSCLSFDGSGDNVNLGTGSEMDVGTGAFTLTQWIKPKTGVAGSNRSIFSNFFNFGNDQGKLFQVRSAGTVRLLWGNTTYATDAILDNWKWQWISFV